MSWSASWLRNSMGQMRTILIVGNQLHLSTVRSGLIFWSIQHLELLDKTSEDNKYQFVFLTKFSLQRLYYILLHDTYFPFDSDISSNSCHIENFQVSVYDTWPSHVHWLQVFCNICSKFPGLQMLLIGQSREQTEQRMWILQGEFAQLMEHMQNLPPTPYFQGHSVLEILGAPRLCKVKWGIGRAAAFLQEPLPAQPLCTAGNSRVFD